MLSATEAESRTVRYRSKAFGTVGEIMVFAEPIIVVLGPWCGGTSAVAGVLHHLGVFMGADFVWAYRGPPETWEDSHLSKLCVRAFTEPGAQLQMDAGSFQANLQSWADEHRLAARTAGRRP